MADLAHCYRPGAGGTKLPFGMLLQRLHPESDQYARVSVSLVNDINKFRRKGTTHISTIYIRHEIILPPKVANANALILDRY